MSAGRPGDAPATAVPAPAPATLSRTPLSSWGRLSHDAHVTLRLADRRTLPPPPAGLRAVAYGNGRSYGDASLNPQGAVWLARGLDKFIRFDTQAGVLECEAGVLLDDIITLVLPRGWFLPVTPGTRFVTLGGAVANDVHGKNHHRAGTLGEHVLALTLLRSDGEVIECDREQARGLDWLQATIGGLGLTGVISTVRLQLLRVPGACMEGEAVIYRSLDEFFAVSAESEAAWDYGVSWIDCLHGRGAAHRGVFFRANHAPGPLPDAPAHARSLPFTPPVSLVGSLSLRAFNAAYFQAQRRVSRRGRSLQPLLPFFYPLDGLQGWNRMYGPGGFYQYQCVVPRPVQADATAALLNAIRQSGQGSFLAVLKTFGDRPAAGLLSFPMGGTTLALDFPNGGAATESLFQRLDAIVLQAGGRLYPAKDARMSRAMFRAGYPRLAEFLQFRDPGMASAMSRRLLDD